ncbi:ankyrin-1-like [Impatiens glandulifera]|uniref:ankyrin-1-like n=1 Tax=Impatiens glandulifera TaxID=253017 RepID=UPI001FB0F8C4|nr:ankyrin-1-like [Impatiens glandulifera]
MNKQNMFEHTLEEHEEYRILIKECKELMGFNMDDSIIPPHLRELNDAIENLDVNRLRLALDNLTSDIDEPFYEDKETALHYACEYGSLPCVELLLHRGANLQAKNAWGETPLHIASCGSIEIVELLLNRAINQNTKKSMLRSVNKEGSTPLHEAASAGDENIDVVRVLLAADMNKQNIFEHTLEEQEEYRILIKECKELMESMGDDMDDSIIPPHLQELNDAVENHQDVNRLRLALDNLTSDIDEPFYDDKETALHVACEYGSLPCVELLLDRGANKQAKNACGETPLHIASYCGDTEIVELLLNRAANQNTKNSMLRSLNKEGSTPLHEAASGGDENIDVVRVLLAAGASTEKTNYKNKLAKHNTQIRSLLKKKPLIMKRKN